MAANAYVSWLTKREFKMQRSGTDPGSEREESGSRTPRGKLEISNAKGAATARKRPRDTAAKLPTKLSALRSLKRRLEGVGDETGGIKARRTTDDGSESSDITVRPGTRSGHQKQCKQQQDPVLLEESCYWLAVQRFSQLG
ncbi:unnamed protein product [Phytophthora fragariaefolia]|uniref:Unnamed protein product n=1 Tax=Phytophthora fragariaefolia TaxID=1490495 RepID=A0A9W6Y8T1_9STRA|nr:unnamed protein product [Phytophthora fragariaefolia]